jgi:hypothetical protein
MDPRRTARSPHPVTAPGPTRLPWWALVLPVLAFAALLTLVGGSAHADSGAFTGPLGRIPAGLVGALVHLLAHLA